ncbi:hypothetical protein AB4Y67_05720 [Arthrobacter sp. YAF17]|uniref:hypothetical protein n=1 Tax=Arthrobacter sp. YAF17 TaxID=3233077 RepID=UPI003F8E4D88
MTPGGDAKIVQFRTYMPLRYRAALAGIGVATVAVLLLAGQMPLLAVFVAAVFMAAMTMSVRVQLDDVGLSIRVAGLFSTTVPYGEITAVSAGPITGFLQGMGLRILPGGGTGYLVGGPTVRIQCSNTTVLVSCADTQRLVTGIGARI